MRIALITDGVWPYVLGGMQKHSYYLCKYLAQNKVYVDLVHYNNSFYDITKLQYFSEEEKKYINSIVVPFPTGNNLPGHYIKQSKQYSKLIFETIKDNIKAYDFIYTKGFSGWHLIEEKRKGNIKCAKIGVKFHGYEMFQKPPSFTAWLQQVFLLRSPVKQISTNADVVFSYGGKITNIIKALGVPDSKIAEFPSGVESSFISYHIIPCTEKIKFLYLGRYERRKGIEELNKAIKQIHNVNAEFHFIGPIPEEKKIQASNCIYYGEIRDKQFLHEKIRGCDVLICPSWSEGMPNSILESMANGLSAIATDVGSTNILVNNETGWLINSPNTSDIVKAIETVLASTPQKIDTKKQNALNHIKIGFVWERLIYDLINKLESLV